MALSSMLLGHWTRPPYWKVLLRFCSQALAMPVQINRSRLIIAEKAQRCGWVSVRRVWGLLWYWFAGLEETPWRNFSRNGFRTSEQRWNAVRMYSSLHPLWQLSLHGNTWTDQTRAGGDHAWRKKVWETYALGLVLAVTCFISWQ